MKPALPFSCSQALSSRTCVRCSGTLVRFGFFFRKNQRIQRYRCKACGACISDAFFDPFYRFRIRNLANVFFHLFCSGLSQRRMSLILALNPKTVVRHFLLIANLADQHLDWENQRLQVVTEMQFDDMESFIHTKCKPVSLTLAVENKTRRILGVAVASMPAKGLLAKIARRRYGKRVDQRKQMRRALFAKLRPIVHPRARIQSDMNPHYAEDVKEFFPQAFHEVFKGRRGCVVGQGELKRGGYDPLFSLNHTAAMIRANVNRLFRRTWNTSKRMDRLELHVRLYALYHNSILIQ